MTFKRKIKSILVAAVLVLIAAVLAFVGIYFSKGKKVSADAASAVNQVNFVQGQTRFHQMIDKHPTVSLSAVNGTYKYNTDIIGSVDLAVKDNKTVATVKKELVTNKHFFQLSYMSFCGKVSVAPMTSYTIEYVFDANMIRRVNSTKSTVAATYAFYYFGDTDKTDTITYVTLDEPTCSDSTVQRLGYLFKSDKTDTEKPYPQEGLTVTVTHTNDTGTTKTFEDWFGLLGGGSMGTDYYGGYETTITVSSCNITVSSTPDPTANKYSDTYRGTPINFMLDYNADEASVIGVSKEGVDISPMPITDKTLSLTDVGEYKVKFKILPTSLKVWEGSDGEDKGEKELTFTINKAKPTVVPKFASTSLIESQGLPQPSSYTATLNGNDTVAGEKITGTFEWRDQTLSASQPKYEWTFVPDSKNFAEVTGEQTFTVKEVELTGIEASLKDLSAEIYDRFTAEDLKPLLSVKAVYNDGSKTEIAEGLYSINAFTLTAGDNDPTNKLTIKYNIDGHIHMATVSLPKVLEAQLESIMYTVNVGDNKITPNTTIDDFKTNYIVDEMAKWNYKTTAFALNKSDYQLAKEDGTPVTKFTVGTNTLYVLYENTLSAASFTLEVVKDDYNITAKLPTDNSAEYDGQPHKVELSASELGALPSGVTPVYTYKNLSDGTESSTAPTEAGEYEVTVSFTHTNTDVYNDITYTDKTTLEITQKGLSEIKSELEAMFTSLTVTFDGEVHNLLTEEDYNRIAEINQEYADNGDALNLTVKLTLDSPTGSEFTGASEVNEEGYVIYMTVTHDNPNYAQIEIPDPQTLIITSKTMFDKSGLGFESTDNSLGEVQKLGENFVAQATYNGNKFTVKPTGTLKDKDGANDIHFLGSDYMTVTYEKYGKGGSKETVSEIKDAGHYVVKVVYDMTKCIGKDDVYKDYVDSVSVELTLNVQKATYTPPELADKTETYDGTTAYTIAYEAGALESWITPVYTVEGQTETSFTAAGTYVFTVTFTHDNPNYERITASVTATLTVELAELDISKINEAFGEDIKAAYGEEYDFTISDEILKAVEPTLTVTYTVTDSDGKVVEKAEAAGNYTVTATFTHTNANYKQIAPISAKLIIGKTGYNAKFTFDDVTVDWDGQSHTLTPGGETADLVIEGNSEGWISFEYYLNGEKFEGASEIGVYEITIKFTHTNVAYEAIADMTAKLTIKKSVLAAPVYASGADNAYKYTGGSILPDGDRFKGFDGEIMQLVIEKSESGINAGTYKAVFALLDTEHYEWANGGATEKPVTPAAYKLRSLIGTSKAVAVDDVVLGENEVAVNWNIAKAQVTATKTAGRLPVYKSDSYKGSFDGLVEYKYYTDESCSEEILAEDMVAGQQYFVKAELLDNENFEVAPDAQRLYFSNPFAFSLAEDVPAAGNKVVEFIKSYWMYFAIGLVALLLIILIIIIAVNSHKNKKRAAEQREEERMRHDEEMKMLMMMMNKPQTAPQGAYAPAAIDMEDLAKRVAAALMPAMQATAQLTAGGEYDDAEVKRRLSESERRISEMQELLDGDDGFNDVIEYNDGLDEEL